MTTTFAVVSPAVEEAADSYQRVDADTKAPICGVHDLPMTWQQGRKGFF